MSEMLIVILAEQAHVVWTTSRPDYEDLQWAIEFYKLIPRDTSSFGYLFS